MLRSASAGVSASGPGSASENSYGSNCTCKLPALAVLAASPGSLRSATTTSRPSRARNSAALNPTSPPPITSTSQSPGLGPGTAVTHRVTCGAEIG